MRLNICTPALAAQMTYISIVNRHSTYLCAYRCVLFSTTRLCTYFHTRHYYITKYLKRKVKLSLQQAVEDYAVLRRRGSHIFKTTSSVMTVRLSALGNGRALTSRNIPGKGRVNPKAIRRLEGRNKLKSSIDLIGNRNRDLATCSLVPQPITLARAPIAKTLYLIIFMNSKPFCLS
jgi:hypothetical protein